MARGSRRWASDAAKCPFYKWTEYQCLFCEGSDRASIRLSFPAKTDRGDYFQKYCADDYHSCVIYMASEIKVKKQEADQ